jgi:Ca2+-binding EF-hand superfamily protein
LLIILPASTVFESHDIDDTGYLDNNSLYEALVELKLPVQLEDMPDLFESVGRQKEKTIDLEDFMDIVTELQVIINILE